MLLEKNGTINAKSKLSPKQKNKKNMSWGWLIKYKVGDRPELWPDFLGQLEHVLIKVTSYGSHGVLANLFWICMCLI